MAPLRETELPKANRIFVGRAAELRAFEKAAFAIPPDRAILRVIYGPGGQGKTWLCREMMQRTDKDPSYGFLRCALLDLHERLKTDPDLLLVWIRNEFAKAGIDLPAFDLALALAWEATRGEQPFPSLARPWLSRSSNAAKSTVEEGVDWLGSDTAKALVGEIVGELPGGSLLKRLGGWVIDKSKRAYLERTRESLKRLYDKHGALRSSYELSARLPWMLAQDLNHHLAANPTERLVLFVDEYERVFDQGGAGARWGENPFDRHMRRLIQETNGLLAVFFSRESLPWENHPDWREDLAGHQHLLGGLADPEADAFLRAIPIEDTAIRQAIVEGARERADPAALVYALMLDLQVDHWRALTARGQVSPECFTIEAETFEGRCVEMVERVLRDYDLALQTTIERLSVAQRFDRAAFAHVVSLFGTALPLDSFDRIAELSFVTRASDGFLSLHNIIAGVIRARMGESKRAQSVEALLEHFSKRAEVENHSALGETHILALSEAAFLRRQQNAEGYVDWLARAVEPLRATARYSQAASHWQEAASFVKEALDIAHPDTASCLNNLADLLSLQGDYARCKSLYELVLKIRISWLGDEHLDTATSYNNLAALMQELGDYFGAKSFYERSLVIQRKNLGNEHYNTLNTLNNIASLLQLLGRHYGSKILYIFVLKYRRKSNGIYHSDTASSFNNLASLLENIEDYAGAKRLYKFSLAIREKILCADHPDIARSLNNLALLHGLQKDFALARPLHERALAIREIKLGPEHRETATSLNNIGLLIHWMSDCKMANYAEAQPYYERALAIRQAVLGPEHPSTGASHNNLASLLRALGDYTNAKLQYQLALAIYEKKHGVEHRITKGIRENLESLLSEITPPAAAPTAPPNPE